MVLRERAVPDLKGTTLDQEKIYPLIPFNWRVNSTLHIFSRLQGSLHLLVALICPCFKSFFFVFQSLPPLVQELAWDLRRTMDAPSPFYVQGERLRGQWQAASLQEMMLMEWRRGREICYNNIPTSYV